ncbi:hypothetical protein F0562_003135 [Nyssa sinensis]|uniref:glucan endo-1,3-beta-D-glucosidase n=1 Tax=Nyssa sinensis TaxID=561372 RepID=A0A5J5BV96_9ASTE|nr:hypothetical protein F0562_003135 [Nyssa sinensis]
MADFMNLGRRANSNYPQLRCFDLWKLHSWAGGLAEFADGRHQESTSQAVNAYYSAVLLELAYGDTHLVAIESTLSAMEIQSAQNWWHVREGDIMYAEDFTRENRMVGVLWANKRDNGLWFAPPEWRESLEREGVGDGWKGFVYALEGIYEKRNSSHRQCRNDNIKSSLDSYREAFDVMYLNDAPMWGVVKLVSQLCSTRSD